MQTNLITNKYVATLLMAFTGLITQAPGQEVEDVEFLKKFDELAMATACAATTASEPDQFKLNLSRSISYEEAIKMTFWNKGKQLGTGTALPFPDDIKWKRDVINPLFSIFKKACPPVFVAHEYMNIMREFVMVYLNSVEPREAVHKAIWEAFTKSLVECDGHDIATYNFTSAGLLITGFVTSINGSMLKAEGGGASDEFEGADEEGEKDQKILLTHLIPQKESADAAYELDIVIENLWAVFSHAWALCYPKAPSKELWLPRLQKFFFKAFLAPFEKRWKQPGPLRFFMDTIVGDFDVARMQYNINYCLEASYSTNNIAQAQLVRPVRLAEVFDGIGAMQNHKLT